MEHGVDKGLIEKLSDGSEESAKILQAIVDDGGENIDALNEELARVEEGKQRFSEVVADMKLDFTNKTNDMVQQMNEAIANLDQADQARIVGMENIQGLINGAESKRAALVATYTSIANEALAAYRAVMAQKSPSRKMIEAGVNDVLGVILGAESKKEELRETYGDLAKTALHAVETTTPAAIMPPSATERHNMHITEIISAVMPHKTTGGFTLVQNIYADETSYAAQQREAAKRFKQAAREVYA
jgi:hypothetical protein